MYERLDTVILIGEPLGLQTRESIMFLRHGKHFCCSLYNIKWLMLLMELFIVPFSCVGS